MIIKIQDDKLNDRFLTEAAYIKWVPGNDKLYAILEVYIVSTESRRIGATSITESTCIEADPSLRLTVYDGDRVFIMNNEGKTIDSKRIELKDESENDENNREYEK